MSHSRRRFLVQSSLGFLGAAALRAQEQNPGNLAPATPSAFGTSPEVGPEVSTTTFAEAEKVVQFPLTDAERAMAAQSWRRTMAYLYERRTGPRKVALEDTLAPASVWNPAIPGVKAVQVSGRFVRSAGDPGPLPARDEDIAYAPVVQLSR